LLIAVVSIPSVLVFGNASAFVAFVGFGGLLALGLLLANSLLWFVTAGWNLLARSLYFLGLLLLASAPPAYFTVWMIGFLDSESADFNRAAVVLTVGFAFVALLVSAVDATRRALIKVEDELERTIEVLRWHLAKTKGEMWQRQLSLARTLHGPIQALMTAHSIRIDLASVGEKPALALEALRECRVAIDELGQMGALPTEIEKDITTIRERWSGICEVTTSISNRAKDALRADPISARIVIDLIQDGLSNAVRHGAANRVALTIEVLDDALISVTLADNGVGFTQPVVAGVGSSQLDALSLNWSLLRVDASTVLRFTVPFGEFTEPALLD
jgi:signal transduction histidine kinase